MLLHQLVKHQPASAKGGSVTWMLVPMICGAGHVTFTQLPENKFVRDRNVNPAFASGHGSGGERLHQQCRRDDASLAKRVNNRAMAEKIRFEHG